MVGAIVKSHSVSDIIAQQTSIYYSTPGVKRFHSTKRRFNDNAESNVGSEQIGEQLEHATLWALASLP